MSDASVAVPQPVRRVTLLTDFGTADGYASAMRGVMASRCAHVVLEDASHDVPPGDIPAAAHALSRYWLLYPPATVHVVVVDPGVGGARRALAVSADSRIAIGPDNGVLNPMLERASEVRSITNDRLFVRDPSATFHGRDIFAPVAAFLACGGAMADVGETIDNPVRLPRAEPVMQDERVLGRIVHVDRFGNLITNIGASLAHEKAVWIAERRIGALHTTYADVLSGELLALIGSTGMVEISVRDGSAAQVLGAGRGVTIELRPDSN